MIEKLDNILHIMENYFKDSIFILSNPVSEKDLKLSVLCNKLYYLKNNFSESDNINDQIQELLIYMEESFDIPRQLIDIMKWIPEDCDRNQFVLDLYVKLYNLCF